MKIKNQHPDCSDCTVKNCILRNHCSAKWLPIVNESKIHVNAKHGQQIILEGTPVSGIYLVHSGKVKIHKTGLLGKDLILKLGKTGDILGHCGSGPRYTYHASVTAIENSAFCFIDIDLFKNLLRENPELTYSLLLYYTAELQQYESRLLRLLQMNVREKVAASILLLREVFGENFENNYVQVCLSRQDLASISGTTREQVSKTLSELKNDKIINLSGRYIGIVDSGKLLSAAGV